MYRILGLKNRRHACQKADAFEGSKMDTSFAKLTITYYIFSWCLKINALCKSLSNA